ncbi:MAG: hybrid sensor histidine kinase/response regulator [Flavipsychrobacter sp.]
MILIVDDKPENIFSLKTLLEINKFDVDTASSGEEALKKILQHSYSLIILDVQMPGMDGFEVAEAISGYSKAKDIPIIFLSAASKEKKFITKGYNSGGIDYVTKPVDPDILLLKVKTFHRLFEQTRELNRIHHELQRENAIRKQAEQDLGEMVQELYSILESIPQIAFSAKPDGEIEFVNEHWYRYSADAKKFPATINDASLEDLWKELIHEENQFTCEVFIRNLQTNEPRYHLLRAVPVKNEQGEVIKWVCTLTDIHEQKTASQLLERKVIERTKELQEINRELEASNNDLQQFASVASHDLKEPLRKIQVFSSIIKEKYLNDTLNTSSYLDRVIHASARMDDLIGDLLNYSRLSVTSLFKPTDINEAIQGILKDLELTIVEKGATINVGYIPELEVIPGQIRQLFQNLLSNALKFTKKDVKPVIDIQAELVVEKKADSVLSATGQYCRLSICDNGIGFSEKYLDRIFTIFQRLNSKDAYEGTGIGLAIAKRIVDKHNGIITARSKENEGACFIIVLPIHQPSANHTILHASLEEEAAKKHD